MAQSNTNPQIVDSVTQVNALVLGEAPAQAMATLYQTSAASAGIAIQNAVHAQNSQNAINSAATAEAIQTLLTSPTAASAAASAKIDGALEGKLSRLMAMLENLEG